MATKYVRVMTDDLDGDEAAETVRFGFDGLFYEIDLSLRNLGKYRELFAPLIAAGRRLGKISGSSGSSRPASPDGSGPAPGRVSADMDKVERRAAREWIRGHGVFVADRGALRHDFLMFYRNRHADPAPAELLALAGKQAEPEPPVVPAQSTANGRARNGGRKSVPKADFQPAAS